MEFVGRAIQHPLFSMMRWYLKSRGAVCLTTGMSLRKNMGKKYQLEMDHIFPYSRLKKAGYGKGNRVKYALAQEFTNRAILTQTANRSKQTMEPSVYLADVKTRFPKALGLQCIPEEPDSGNSRTMRSFWTRGATCFDDFNEFLNSITLTEEPEAPATIEDLIPEGESDELEFKSTLRWDLKNGETSKKMEEVIVKTVAAFANGQGGTLVIGVDDDGNVLGLGHDYLSLGGATRDKFEVHLRNLLNEHLGAAFVASKSIVFHDIGEFEVCQVDIEPAIHPIVLVTKDKNGQKVEKFYVRSGNASHEMPMSEMSAYMKERFH